MRNEYPPTEEIEFELILPNKKLIWNPAIPHSPQWQLISTNEHMTFVLAEIPTKLNSNSKFTWQIAGIQEPGDPIESGEADSIEEAKQMAVNALKDYGIIS